MDRGLQLPEIALWLATQFRRDPCRQATGPPPRTRLCQEVSWRREPPTYAHPAPGILTNAAVGSTPWVGPVLVSGIVRARLVPGPKVTPRRGPWPPGGAHPRSPRA